MATFLISTSGGNVYYSTQFTKPADVTRSFMNAVAGGAVSGVQKGVTVRGVQSISQGQFNTGLAGLGVTQPKATSGGQTMTSTGGGGSSLQQIMNQMSQLERSFAQQYPQPQRSMYENLFTLRNIGGRIGKRIEGLPEELKNRFKNLLVPEQFRARKQDIETEGLVKQLEKVSNAERSITDMLSLLNRKKTGGLTDAEIRRREREAEKARLDEELSASKSNLFSYFRQLQANPNITPVALRNLVRSRGMEFANASQSNSSAISSYVNSLVSGLPTKEKADEDGDFRSATKPSGLGGTLSNFWSWLTSKFK